jgi:hypothetical protein
VTAGLDRHDFASGRALNYEWGMRARRRTSYDLNAGIAGEIIRLRKQVNDYDALRDYLAKRKLPELVLSFEQIEEIIGAALPRAAQRASWWETLRSPQEKMPQREACLAAGYIAIRLPDGKGVRFRKMPSRRRGEHREP